MKKQARLKFEVLAVILLIAAFSLALFFVGAERIVAFIGVENSYLVTFFIALFGGMTSVGGVSYTASIVTFVSGGAMPWLIALAAGAGTAIGDSIYYLVSRRGARVLGEGWLSRKIKALSDWLSKRSGLVKFLGIYAYISFTPLPNDLLTITLGISQVPKKIVLPAVILGDFTFAFLLAYIGDSLPFLS